jgi:phage FluMu gp28-like protein
MQQTIRIDANPHVGQAEVHLHPARFKVLAAGRRWGKTRLGVNECVDVATRGGRAWWVAPSYKMAAVGWRPLRRIGVQAGAEILRGERSIMMQGGGSVQVRSADNPDSLRGEGLDYVVLDECAYMRHEVFNEALRPALSDRKGRALFISTPKGRNWFWRFWARGNDGEDSEWKSFRFPTGGNPYIDTDEIAAARASLPERIFEQEYLAEFLEDAGGVFRRVMAAADAEPQDEAITADEEADPAVLAHTYVMGVDWGKHSDFTVLAVVDIDDGALVHLDRFNRIDYDVQVGRLRVLADRFKPQSIVAESNSMGEPLIDSLKALGLPVHSFATTNASKKLAIDELALAFESGTIRIIPDPVLISELQAYETERLASGMLRYTAPSGMHDDTVMALALAWQGASMPYGADLVSWV